MAVGRVVSERYPYLLVELRVGDQVMTVDALVDTGLDGDMIVPEQTPFEQPSDSYRSRTFADGSGVDAPVYYGTLRIGEFDHVPADIARLGRETIIGRGVIDRYLVTFDHGARVAVEP